MEDMQRPLIKLRPRHEIEANTKRANQEDMIRSAEAVLKSLETDKLRFMGKLADICQHIERIGAMKEQAKKDLELLNETEATLIPKPS